MKTRMRKGISMVLAFILAMTLLAGPVIMAAPSVEPPLATNLTITADTRMVYPGDTVTYTVGFNLLSGAISGYSATQIVILLPTGLDYVSSVTNISGAPAVVTTVPIATPAGKSLALTFNNNTMTPGPVTIYVTTTVSPATTSTGLRVDAELYLQPYRGSMPTTSNQHEYFVVTRLIRQTTTPPLIPLAAPVAPLDARIAPAAADITPMPMPTPMPTPVTPQLVRVEFNLAGGTRTGGGELVQSVPIGASAVAPIAVRSGYTLAGWDTPFVNVTQNIVVTARWTQDPVVTPVPPIATIPPVTPVPPIYPIDPAPITPTMSRVTFNLAGGTRIGGGELVQYIATGGSAVAPIATRSGYNFVGWDSPYGNVMNDITVTARWAADTPAVTPVPPVAILPPVTPITPEVSRVTFNLNGGVRVGGGALVQAIPVGGSAVEPYVSRNGYIFTGWDRSFTNVRQNITVTAQWTKEAEINVVPPTATVVVGHFANEQNTFTQFSHMPLIFYAESHLATFVGVEVDGRALTAGTQFVATTGTGAADTTAIFLKASYLNTLGPGSHTLKINFKGDASATTTFTVAAYTNTFLDVSANDWFYKGVQAMNASGLLMGVSNTSFDPQGSMTRGMVVTLLYRFTGEPSVTGFRNPFPDVAAGQYYTNAVIWAAANGIVTGHDTGLFAPQDLMTHEQFAAVLFRYQNALGNTAADVLADRTFSDFAQISSYAQSAVNKLTMQGVFRDWPYDAQNRFQPQASVTRAEVATVMRLWIESIGW